MGHNIPEGISAENVISAISDYEAGNPHGFGESTGYDLIYDNKKYPPKAILGLAAAYVVGAPLSPKDFKGGVGSKCFQVLLSLGFSIVPKEGASTPGEDWTDEELRASIESYLRMLEYEQTGEIYKKKDLYRELSAIFGRTEKSYEYRAENISHVLELQGRNWVPGLKPAKNVGTNVVERIEKLLAQVEGRETYQSASFESRVRKELSKPKSKKPSGNNKPETTKTTSTGYVRDPAVKAWVLQEAAGVCEMCNQPAPFKTYDGGAFLEVHHVQGLAEGGPDTVTNAVAVCPNCHRALHFASNRVEMKEDLLAKVDRLMSG